MDYLPFHENYSSANFNLKGFFKDSTGVIPKLVKELRTELISRASHQKPSAITRDLGSRVPLMNIMELSWVAFSFRFYDTYMNFMFENIQLSKKEWKKSEFSVFAQPNSTVFASFEF